MSPVHVLLFVFLSISAYSISAEAAAVGDASVETEALVRHYRDANFTTEMVLEDLLKKTPVGNNETRSRRSTTCYTSTSLFGGTGGRYFADAHTPCPSGITRIQIYANGHVIRSIRAIYRNPTISAVRHGSADGTLHDIYLSDERIFAVVGRAGNSGQISGCVFQLAFLTVKPNGDRRVLGPYGPQAGSLFIYHQEVVSFRGRSGSHLDAIGFFHV